MIGRRIQLVDEMLSEIFPAFASSFAEYLPEGGLEVYEKFSGNFLKVNKTLAMRSPWTIAHQDYRVENMLFGPTNGPAAGQVVVLDWQGIGRGPFGRNGFTAGSTRRSSLEGFQVDGF